MQKWGWLALAGTVVLSGCGGDSDDDVESFLRERTGIYFHNQLGDQSGSGNEQQDTTVDVIIRNDLSGPLFEAREYSTTEQDGMAFKLESDTETVLFDINNATATLVDDTGIALAAGENYTLVLMGLLAGSGDQVPKLKAYEQIPASVDAGQVRVRFVHALADKADQNIDVSVGASTLASGLDYGAVSSYQTGAPESSSTLTVTLQVGAASAVDRSCSIQLGRSYDAIIAHPAPDSTGVALYCQEVDAG
ncbi:hypothetical protein A15D_02063 [Alcanivorax sp. MD8A]|uniref:DUF4397 domain-containing protein n=1 Tax=Alcanivorax profundi TaxID=2338368 RepID=A0A418Y081_9GAMM|nr:MULTISPECIES: DUF4397 domain-containing protein [Alcanivorax]ERP90104.1 hypothetical protein Q670_14495 [Alcanivorax sp. P2S70]PNE02364.1 hypothetical protein A15D_02063 [Alcanivorax sp. MD8A]RJG18698.1 DUF4397 domain-containing protein [Alcanivorax profundi]